MAKSFKKFREEWEDDEWGEDENYNRRKQKQMEKRKAQRREKYESRWDEVSWEGSDDPFEKKLK